MSGATPPLRPPSVRIQYASDLHLEFFRADETGCPALERLISSVQRLAPLLVLAGDIGDPFRPEYARFLEAMADRFDRVLLVAGNHEFYGHAPRETLRRIEEVCSAWPNLVFLNNSAWEGDVGLGRRVRFFGGTMWSRIKAEERSEVAAMLNDFARIRGFGLAEYEREHVIFADLLDAELAALEEGAALVVISHYLPSFRLIHPQYRASSINSAFATEMEAADHPRVAAWFYGHTHKGRAGPRFFCNPLGYPGENAATTLNRVAEIPYIALRPSGSGNPADAVALRARHPSIMPACTSAPQ